MNKFLLAETGYNSEISEGIRYAYDFAGAIVLWASAQQQPFHQCDPCASEHSHTLSVPEESAIENDLFNPTLTVYLMTLFNKSREEIEAIMVSREESRELWQTWELASVANYKQYGKYWVALMYTIMDLLYCPPDVALHIVRIAMFENGLLEDIGDPIGDFESLGHPFCTLV